MKALRSLFLVMMLVGVTWISTLQYKHPIRPSSAGNVSSETVIDAASIKRAASERAEVSPEGTPGKLLTAVKVSQFRAVPQHMETLLMTLSLIGMAILTGVLSTWWRSVSSTTVRKYYQPPKIIYESTCNDPNCTESHRD